MVDRRVLFFGDSHVLGYRDPEGLGWPGRIARASAAKGLPFTAYNLGVRGQTSVEVAGRWEREAACRVVPAADCRVVFSFGVNDTTILNGMVRVEPGSSASALAEALDGAAERRLSAFVVGPAPVADERHNDRIARLSDAFASLCHRAKVPYVSAIRELRGDATWKEEAAGHDGAHPATRGYGLLADAVLAAGWIDWLSRPAEVKR
jgi:lysophospholipase L1-like esterase